jgi:NAD(P)-dependent dehydrogenase (short-subunit alcohol dehydrogenase family)
MSSHVQSRIEWAVYQSVRHPAGIELFVASDQSSYVTGSDLMADGGVGQV